MKKLNDKQIKWLNTVILNDVYCRSHTSSVKRIKEMLVGGWYSDKDKLVLDTWIIPEYKKTIIK
jgi:hypothetical protein